MVNVNFDLKDVAEVKIGKRTFKAGDLSEASVGDFLMYVDEPCDIFTVGTLYSIQKVHHDVGDIIITIKDDDGDDYRVIPPDDEFILIKPDYSEREREFICFGRKPEEFRVGDIVQVIGYNCGSKTGTVGVIRQIDDDGLYAVSNGIDVFYEAHIRLIAPVEHTNPVK